MYVYQIYEHKLYILLVSLLHSNEQTHNLHEETWYMRGAPIGKCLGQENFVKGASLND